MSIRQDRSHRWINNEEVDRQINEFATTAKTERSNQLVMEFQAKMAELDKRKAQGYNVAAEVAELKLQHRINAASPHVHHETRWKAKNEVAQEQIKVQERMRRLGDRYRDRTISDKDYWSKFDKLRAKHAELGKQL